VRVKIGETATTQVVVDLQYRCSSCGKDNLITETISGSAYTATFMGINSDKNLVKHSEENLVENIAVVMDQNDPQRFRAAEFTCTCKNCGYAEPWARMKYDKLEKPKTISVSILVLSAIMFLMSLKSINYAMSLFFFAIVALSATACVCINRYKDKRMEKIEQLIAQLPKESLPTILPHSKDRHEEFVKAQRNQSGAEVQYDTWVCKECGTQNSMKYGQCKKCGKYMSR